MNLVDVRYFAGAAEAAGTHAEQLDAASAGELRAAMLAVHGPAFGSVLDRCSVLAEGVRLEDPLAPLRAGVTVDVLPPFAGG